jgi:phosphoglycerol transferase MdoB-like AlkP superfamily enzyme
MRIHLSFPRRLSLSVLLMIRLTAVLLLFGFTRWLFYFVNIENFAHLNIWQLLHIMWGGIRYDLAVIAIVNLPFIALMTIPFHFRYNFYYQRITNVLFVLFNSVALLFNLIDVIFFRYIAKRTTSEVFAFFGNTAENTGSLLFTFLADFWYMLLIFFILVFLLIRVVTWFISHSPVPVVTLRWYITQSLIFIGFAAVAVIFGRGGLQLKPISLINAANYTESKNISLLINTPFSIMQTVGKQSISKLNYFNEQQIEAVYNPVHTSFSLNLTDSIPFTTETPNIVILIIESMGREFIGYYNPDKVGITPFLDSLLKQSITFKGFANGKRSIEALPSIMAGLPSLMDKEFQATPFIANHILGLGTILKSKGYQTAFFHGGNNGTMRFDDFSQIAGFDKYYGRNEYANDADFDGKWGIYDEPYLQYFARQLNGFTPPFAAGLFTLSSHHPYHLPDQYKGAFPLASNDMEATFSYTDHALKKFFQTASTMPWFKNTVFVITADHTPEKSHFSDYIPYWSLYGIPIAFYFPQMDNGLNINCIAQHTDIMPTLAALAKTEMPLVAFGNNLFDTTSKSFAVNYLSGIYQMIHNDTLVLFSNQKTIEMYDLVRDPTQKNNLLEAQNNAAEKQEMFFKALLQQYNNRLIDNALIVK